jgi:diguanylate cyclase (GGDEF)-like protein
LAIFNHMTDSKESSPLRILIKIGKITKRKYKLEKLLSSIKQELKNHFKNTKVSVMIEQASAPVEKEELRTLVATSGVHGLAALIMKNKKKVVVNQDVAKFYKKYGIKTGRSVAKSILGLPMLHQGTVYGAIILENMKTTDAYERVDESLMTVLAAHLAAGVARDISVRENTRLIEEIRQLSLIDPLTNVANRRYFDLVFDMEIRKAKGYARQLSLAMIDVDRFRSLNARFGREAADELLVHVAQTLKKNVRDTDFLARYGGEEFAILFPEASNEAAANVAERVRCAVEQFPIVLKGLGRKKVTISLGVVTYPSSAETLTVLLEQVIRALARAKQLGRNQVVAF